MKNDLGFLKIADTFSDYFIPSAHQVANGDFVYLVARHTCPDEDDLDGQLTMAQANKLFYNFNVKCVSSGTACASNEYFVCSAVSCTTGSCGGPLLSKEFSLNHLSGICISFSLMSFCLFVFCFLFCFFIITID
jgi:hypothetical protein